MKVVAKETYNKLNKWIIENPLSYDLLDLKNTPFFILILKLSNKSNIWKKITAPIVILANRYTNVFRFIFNSKKIKFSQAETIIARAYIADYKINKSEALKIKIERILDWILSQRSKDFDNYCWGQPYDWFARKVVKKYTPRATVTTQVANTFLDAYETFGEKKYLEIAVDICDFFINGKGLNHSVDEDGDICFSYTSIDHYHIHNANMLVAAVLIRVWKHTTNDRLKDFAIKSMNFTFKHQNLDGSWYYWALPDKISGIIDNYHTGFILESLAVIKPLLGNEFKFDEKFEKGINYYVENLFEDSTIPKITNKSKYPIDIQSCAQAIITFGELKNIGYDYMYIAENILRWTIDNMMDKKGFFYYKKYKFGRIDKTPYMRWGESWMLRALTFFN